MSETTPTFGSLFSGIGGIDLGLERAGWRCSWQVEKDPWCQRVLAKHWPDVARYEDVKEINADDLPAVDLVCGGFPCQPVSRAGRRLAQADDRWLWPDFARVVRGVRPRFVLVENVPGLLVHAMGDVLGDLAALGYDAEWESLPAAAFGAPHLRDRIWIVGWSQQRRALADAGSGRRSLDDVRPGRDAAGRRCEDVADAEGAPVGAGLRSGGAIGIGGRRPGDCGGPHLVADTEGVGCGALGPNQASEARSDNLFGHAGQWPRGEPWAVEPDVGRVADGVSARVDRLRGLGNAVVPQVVEWIGRRLIEVAT